MALKQRSTCISRRFLLTLIACLWCGGNNRIAQEPEEEPGPLAITCSIENGRRLETGAYTVSNLKDIRLIVNLSNPYALNLGRPPYRATEADSQGKSPDAALSVVGRKLSDYNRQDVDVEVKWTGARGGFDRNKSYNQKLWMSF